jgi:hypothetical protein
LGFREGSSCCQQQQQQQQKGASSTYLPTTVNLQKKFYKHVIDNIISTQQPEDLE